jgi:nucleoside 2-deoxyribosyltransferase
VSEDLQRLRQLRTPTVGEKATKLLLHLSTKNPKVSATIGILKNSFGDPMTGVLTDWNSAVLSNHIRPEYLAWSWAVDFEELSFLLETYLENELGYLESSKKFGHGHFQITPSGWTYLDSLRQGNPNSQVGFIAMWFDKSVDPASLAIEVGIRNSGHEPLRIDRKEHNNKIDDEIVAGIRRSKFLVSDFTGHRGGVYFEAGLATGLGLPVIWLCRQDELEKTHFDTRQYNFIVWEADKLAELTKALQNRIEATIGRGPLTGNAVT